MAVLRGRRFGRVRASIPRIGRTLILCVVGFGCSGLMACYHPSQVNVDRLAMDGYPRRRDSIVVPCGSCLGCREDQAKEWAVRIVHEGQTRPSSWFTTLTYAPENVPGYQEGDSRVHGSLDPEDTRRFIKRLRKRTRQQVGYYLCGEYGDVTQRPHYHALLFGPSFPDRIEHTVRNGAPVWVSKSLDDTWGLGLSELTALNFSAAKYVAGYVRKKVRKSESPHFYERVDTATGELQELIPEFGRMSRRPAIGRTWIERYYTDAYPHDFVVVDGVPRKPPRYYDKWMQDNHPEMMEEVRHQRWQDAERLDDEKLIMMEKVHRNRDRFFSLGGTL